MIPTMFSSLKKALADRQSTPFVGIYDLHSASIAAREFPTLFVSGYGFSASHYGLPDNGFLTWTDLSEFVARIRHLLPETALLVDIDEGFGDPAIAAHVAGAMEQAGAFGIILEDQRKPKRCGHFSGKEIIPIDEYLLKLHAVLSAKRHLFVVARTDASDPDEVLKRVIAYEKAGADAVLADGITDIEIMKAIRESVQCPIGFNQIAGGRSPSLSLNELEQLGVSLAIYSTPCLFAAQHAISDAIQNLKDSDGLLSSTERFSVRLPVSQPLLEQNLRTSRQH